MSYGAKFTPEREKPKACRMQCGTIRDHHVLYINTSVELWNPYEDAGSIPPAQRTLYARHMALRRRALGWAERGSTAVVEHGANPGLVSHWTKVALEDITKEMMNGYELQAKQRIMTDEIIDGKDELGVLLLGHDLNGWWVGSHSVRTRRRYSVHRRATCLFGTIATKSGLSSLSWQVPQPSRKRSLRHTKYCPRSRFAPRKSGSCT